MPVITLTLEQLVNLPVLSSISWSSAELVLLYAVSGSSSAALPQLTAGFITQNMVKLTVKMGRCPEPLHYFESSASLNLALRLFIVLWHCSQLVLLLCSMVSFYMFSNTERLQYESSSFACTWVTPQIHLTVTPLNTSVAVCTNWVTKQCIFVTKVDEIRFHLIHIVHTVWKKWIWIK